MVHGRNSDAYEDPIFWLATDIFLGVLRSSIVGVHRCGARRDKEQQEVQLPIVNKSLYSPAHFSKLPRLSDKVTKTSSLTLISS